MDIKVVLKLRKRDVRVVLTALESLGNASPGVYTDESIYSDAAMLYQDLEDVRISEVNPYKDITLSFHVRKEN